MWHSVQDNHGFDAIAPEAAVRKGRHKRGHRDDDRDEGAGQQAVDDSGVDPEWQPAGSAAKRRSNGVGKRSKATGSGSGSSSSDKYCTVRDGGRCSWSCTQQYYVDPWCDPGSQPRLHNVVRSTVNVEVVGVKVE